MILLFAHDTYYPEGGARDLIGCYADLDEAAAALGKVEGDVAHAWDAWQNDPRPWTFEDRCVAEWWRGRHSDGSVEYWVTEGRFGPGTHATLDPRAGDSWWLIEN